MMFEGTIDEAGAWTSDGLSKWIEDEMVADEIIDPNNDTEETLVIRRRSLIAMSRGIINYLKDSLEISLQAGDLRGLGENGSRIPDHQVTGITVAGSSTLSVTIDAGELRSSNDTATQVPLQDLVLSHRIQ